ncbi:MAG: universal stress protein [Proteobacteria bacterium]|nr:universal stress protein [Pseudomonadota bacterium]
MKILAALDQTPYAEFVLTKAIKTARQQNAKLDILVVAGDFSDAGDSCGWESINGKLLEAATAAAKAYRQKALAQGIQAKIRVMQGTSPADVIVKYQQAEDLDLIVIGRRSHKGQDPFPIGPVAQRVAAHATCTVMVVR